MKEEEGSKEIESLNEKALNIEELSPEELEQVSGGECGTYGSNCGTFDKCGTFSGTCGTFGKAQEET